MKECAQSPKDKATQQLFVEYDPEVIAAMPIEVQPNFANFNGKPGLFGLFCDEHTNTLAKDLGQKPSHPKVTIIPLEE